MAETRRRSPKSDVVRQARQAAGLTQRKAPTTVSASSMRTWQQWEAGERAMPPWLFELFMLKTRQWSLNDPLPDAKTAEGVMTIAIEAKHLAKIKADD